MNRRIVTAAVVALLAGACHVGSKAEDREPGPEVSRSYQVGAFDKLAVSGPYEVNVVTGGQLGVSAKGGSNLLDETESALRVANALRVAGQSVEGVGGEGGPREVWHWFVLAALLLLMTEWLVSGWMLRA